jgi:hypothetical protein
MSLVVRSPLLRAGLIGGSLASIAGAALTSKIGFLLLAVLLLLPVTTSLSQAGRIAASLQGLRRRAINGVVWGVTILGSAAGALRVESVGALGAGLLIYLSHSGEARTLLKVAQPRSWLVENGRLVIDDAAYVQWAGERLPRAQGFPAVTISSVA